MIASKAIQRVVLVLMVGSLWIMGYVVAPALFSFLDDTALAGSIAGHMFHLASYIVLGSGVVLVGSVMLTTTRPWVTDRRVLLVIIIVVGMAVIEFWLNPWVQRARGSDDFGLLHGLSSVLYLLVSCLGLLLVLIWETDGSERAE